jgi:hypothetical protein
VPPPPGHVVLFNPSTTDADVEVRALWYQGTYDTPTIRTYPFRVPAERLVMVPLVNAPIFDQPEGSISTIMRSAVIVSTPGRDGAEPRQIIVGRTARGGALGVPDARTEHYVGTRLR